MSKNSNIGFILGTHYEIIKRCVKYLPNESLNNAAAVCKSWNNVVKDARKTRTHLQSHFKKRKKSSNNKSCDQKQRNLNYIREIMKSARGLAPKLCIAFCSKALQMSYFRTKTSAARKIHEELRNCLPPDCLSVLAVSDGVMGTQNNDSTIEVALPRCEAFAAITLPVMPGVKVELFRHVSTDTGFEIYKDGKFESMTKADFKQPVKCAVLLTSTHSDAATGLYTAIKERQSEDFAFGGCLAQALSIPSNLSATSSSSQDSNGIVRCSGFLFSGDGLQAASVIIASGESDEELIRNHMLELQSCGFPLEKSMAFMFSCIGRENEVELETEIFRSYFPSTPLLGLVGNGEMGLKCLPNLVGTSVNKEKKQRLSLDHSYSSVIVLLSWH